MAVVKGDVDDEELRQAHKILVPDLSLLEFSESYREFAAVNAGCKAREALKVAISNSTAAIVTQTRVANGLNCYSSS